VDTAPSVGIREDAAAYLKVSALNALARPKFDLSDSELPTDLQ
jgi:hypothetical protein